MSSKFIVLFSVLLLLPISLFSGQKLYPLLRNFKEKQTGECGGLFGGLQDSFSTCHITVEQKVSQVLDQLHSHPITEVGVGYRCGHENGIA